MKKQIRGIGTARDEMKFIEQIYVTA